MALFFRFVRSNLINIIIYIAGCLALAYMDKLPNSVLLVIKWLPAAFLFVNLMLAFIFNKSKLFLLSFILTIGYAILLLPNEINQFQYHILMALGLALPVNIVLFSKTQERGIVSRNGKLKLFGIAAEICIIFYVLIFKENVFISISTFEIIPSFLNPFIIINDLVTLLLLCTVFYFLVTDLLKPYLVKNVCLFVSLFMYMALMNFDSQNWIHMCFIFANLVLFIALMKKSYKMAYHDDLTGIPGRRALNEDLDKLSGMYAIAMMDIDHFKKFNDTYGHDVGDEALRYVARTVDQIVAHGKLYRFGGEEFTVIYPRLAKEEVMINLENIRRTVESNGFTTHSSKSKDQRKKKLKLTLSIGVADHKDTELRPYEVLKKADKGLYKAKKEGRNCIKRA